MRLVYLATGSAAYHSGQGVPARHRRGSPVRIAGQPLTSPKKTKPSFAITVPLSLSSCRHRQWQCHRGDIQNSTCVRATRQHLFAMQRASYLPPRTVFYVTAKKKGWDESGRREGASQMCNQSKLRRYLGWCWTSAARGGFPNHPRYPNLLALGRPVDAPAADPRCTPCETECDVNGTLHR